MARRSRQRSRRLPTFPPLQGTAIPVAYEKGKKNEAAEHSPRLVRSPPAGAILRRVDPLDVQGDLEVHTDTHGAIVRIPLAEAGDWFEWMSRYSMLARSEGLNAQVAPEPGHAVLTVQLPSDTSREQTFELLDAAVGLIERAKAEANGQREMALAVDEHVREWWSAQGDAAS